MLNNGSNKNLSSPKIKYNEVIKITSLFNENGKTIQQIMDEILKNYHVNRLSK